MNDRPRRFAYADPPYPGNAHLYPEGREVDHRRLIVELVELYPDGWALSTGANNLQSVLAMCPGDVRVAAWCKPFCAWKAVNPVFSWEPVIWRGGRLARLLRLDDGGDLAILDHKVANMSTTRGVKGAKPLEVCRWIADLLGYRDGIDRLDDLYPGSGAMGRALDQYRLPLTV